MPLQETKHVTKTLENNEGIRNISECKMLYEIDGALTIVRKKIELIWHERNLFNKIEENSNQFSSPTYILR